MNETGKDIVQQLFGVSSLAEVSPSSIEQLTSKYPYFGATQFLLAKKFKDSNNARNTEQLQKAALYFSNPYWLNYLLHEHEIAEANAKTEPITDEPFAALEAPATPYMREDEIIPAVEIPDEADEIVPAVEVKHDEVVEEADEIIPAVETEDELQEADEIIPAVETEQQIETEQPTAETIQLAEQTKTPVEEELIEEVPRVDEENDPQRLKLSSLIEQHLADFKKPVQENEELPLKPKAYHTIDYFASQGIKAEGQDKFTNRVKKFTDWLKQMKSVNAQPTDLGTDTETEQLIETIAKSSNETKDIVTEAMAEVLVKQGKTEKAVQLYKKLSFLNPAKSTYFATKIEELNNK